MIWKRVISIFGALIICGVIGFLLPFFLSDQGSGVYVDEVALREQFKEEMLTLSEKRHKDSLEQEWVEFIQSYPVLISRYLNTMNNLPATNDQILSVTDINGEIDSEYDVNYIGVIDTEGEEFLDLSELEGVPTGTILEPITEEFVKNAWINQKIAERRIEIADSDLDAGIELYNLLDADYLFEKAEDGLTMEEKDEIKSYLNEKLSDDEMVTVNILFERYVGLLK